MTEPSFLESLARERATAILRTDREDAGRLMKPVLDAGFRHLEFTLTTPGALDFIRDFARDRDLWVGAGTVTTVERARAAVSAGARFLVSPVMDPEIIAEGRRLGVAVMPGVHTPTEMWAAHQAGAPVLKLFPAPAHQDRYIRSVLGPLPFLKIVPTNGVDEHNLGRLLSAGAVAVGLVQCLFPPAAVEDGDVDAVVSRATILRAALPS